MAHRYYTILLSIIGFSLMVFIIATVMPLLFPHIDFVNFWAAPRLALKDPTILSDLPRYHAEQITMLGAPIEKNIWSYPPHLLPLLWPLGLLPAIPAQAVWFVVGFCLCWRVARLGFTADDRMLGLVLMLINAATIANLGQNAFFTAALFLGALWQLDKRPILAGIFLGILTVKPQMGILWPFVLLALGAWRTIFAACVTTLVLVLFSLAVYGVGVWEVFFDFTMPRQWEFIVEPYIPRMYQTVMLSLPNAMQVMELPVELGLRIQYGLMLLAIIGTVVGMRRATDFRTRALLMTSGAMLASPYLLNYDMLALSIVLLWCLLRPKPQESILVTALFSAVFLLPALIQPLHLYHVPVWPLLFMALFAVAFCRSIGYSAVKTAQTGSKSAI